ncbi:MAG: hypothetical protein EON47_08840, partial [Acetobacteraceae bacterium]
MPAIAQAQGSFITLASTTSTEQSGLFGHILPVFTREAGIAVRVVALGTGQALDVGRRGDADALLVHDRAAEDRFVAEGFGGPRRQVMYNDFVLIGPAADQDEVVVHHLPARAAAAMPMRCWCTTARRPTSSA